MEQRLSNPEFIAAELDPFLAVWKRRPGAGDNTHGGGFFHYFALWCFIKLLRPYHVIESGCYKGVGSWFLRQAAGAGANMTFISPSRPSIFVDAQPSSRHLFDAAFRDFSDVPWEVLLTPLQRRSTLIFFDDHQAGLRRAVEAARFGFVHVVFDDNYLPGKGDNYALKSFNAPNLGRGARRWADNFGRPSAKTWHAPGTQLNATDLDALRRIYTAVVDEYVEFPPVWKGPNRFGVAERVWESLTRAPVLARAQALAFAGRHGLRLEEEAQRYTHIAYARLRRGAR